MWDLYPTHSRAAQLQVKDLNFTNHKIHPFRTQGTKYLTTYSLQHLHPTNTVYTCLSNRQCQCWSHCGWYEKVTWKGKMIPIYLTDKRLTASWQCVLLRCTRSKVRTVATYTEQLPLFCAPHHHVIVDQPVIHQLAVQIVLFVFVPWYELCICFFCFWFLFDVNMWCPPSKVCSSVCVRVVL